MYSAKPSLTRNWPVLSIGMCETTLSKLGSTTDLSHLFQSCEGVCSHRLAIPGTIGWSTTFFIPYPSVMRMDDIGPIRSGMKRS